MRTHLGLVALLGLACTASDSPAPPPAGFSPVQVASEATSNGATPMFTVAEDGSRLLSWVAAEDGGEAGALHLQVTRADGVRFGSTLQDPLGGIEPHGEAPPVVTTGPGGAVYALYTVGRDVGARFPASALRFARSDDGGRSWAAPVSVNEGETFGSHNFHALLAGADGRLYAAWLSSVRGESAVWVRASADGGRTWDTARPVTTAPTCPCCRTGLALGPDGTLYASWRKIHDGDIRDVVVAASHDGGETWGAPVRPHADDWVFPGCPHAGPSLKVDSDGTVHIAWWTGKPGSAGIWYARSHDGGATWAAQPIAVGETSMPAHVQLAIEDALVVLAWDDGLGERPVVTLRASVDGGATFGAPQPVSDPSVAATFPVVGLVGDSVTVAWTEVADSTYRAMLAARPDMTDPSARMALPRVGQQEVMTRRVARSALVP